MKYLFVFILTLFSFSFVFAQGEYIVKGQNAYGFSISGSTSPELTAVSGNAAVSNSGIVDLGIGYSIMSSKKEIPGWESRYTIISPFAKAHFLKQSGSYPVTVSALLRYDIYKVNSTVDSTKNSLGSWSVGGAVFHELKLSESYSLQPSVTFSVTKLPRHEYEISGRTITGAEASAAVIAKINEKRIIVKPGIGYSDGVMSYFVSLEFVDLL
ncbi:MAG: hypothetical protein ACM3U0_02175 [archaeon]